jgi:CRISPR-associated protein Cas5d
MFHSFDYPDETGRDELTGNFWRATMRKGILEFPKPQQCDIKRFVRKMTAKEFGLGENILPVEQEGEIQ